MSFWCIFYLCMISKIDFHLQSAMTHYPRYINILYSLPKENSIFILTHNRRRKFWNDKMHPCAHSKENLCVHVILKRLVTFTEWKSGFFENLVFWFIWLILFLTCIKCCTTNLCFYLYYGKTLVNTRIGIIHIIIFTKNI